MTPLAGFVAAILAGWIIREPRRAAAAILVPFLAVLAVQTWTLAAGHGDNPPSTIHGAARHRAPRPAERPYRRR